VGQKRNATQRIVVRYSERPITMTPQESEVLEQMSSHLADLSLHLSECHADAVKTNVGFMAFPTVDIHALILDIAMFQYRLREIGVPVALPPSHEMAARENERRA